MLLGLLSVVAACDPIEDRDALTNSYHPADIKLVATQSTVGGNEITLKLVTKGISGIWDFNIGTKFSDEVTFIYPIKGKSTFTFNVATPYINGGNILNREFVSATIDVQVDKIDHKVNDKYYYLVGQNLEGKTWVFDGTGGDGNLWYYMSPDNNPGAWDQAWWNAGGECCPPADANGKMSFDLDGGANYNYFSSKDGSPTKGRFAFSPDFTKLTISGGVDILGGVEQGSNGTYFIIKLSDDKMILYSPLVAAQGTGWTWIFKPMDS